MEWIHQYWQILSFLVAHISYQIQANYKVNNRMDNNDVEMRVIRQRLEYLERLNETGLAAKCQVHTSQISTMEKRLDNIEGAMKWQR